ncbi:CarD family transcriptional regulator [Actinocorallia longicatena]|uniref:ATP-binding protein n=1 Tax=Actinocorallia longicatena TaxID=111803 RepID=A0ABP6Q9F1_9ACTN
MKPSRSTPRHLPTSPFKPPPPPPPLEKFEVGDLVSHDKYGVGRVTEVTEDVAVVINFGEEQRRIPAPFAKVVKL